MSEHLITIEEANENLLACAARLAEDVKSADGHSEALKVIVPLYLAKGDVDLAAELADTIRDPFTRNVLLSHVAEKCAEINDDDYAFQLIEAIEDIGLQTDTIEIIALRQAARGDFEKTLETAARLEHPDRIFAELALRSVDRGKAGIDGEMLGKIEIPMVKVDTLLNYAADLVKKDRKKEAVEMLEQAVTAAQEINYETDEIRVFTEIGAAFTLVGRKDRAIETLDKARQMAEKMDSIRREYLLSAISLGFFNAGSVDLADRTLDLIDDKTHLSATLLGFARGFWERDEKVDALDALEEAYQILKSQHETETRDSRAKFQLWRSISVQFAGFDRHERAIETAQELIDENQQMEALAEIATVSAVLGRDEFIDQSLRAISEDANRMFALIGVSDAKNRRGLPEDAVKFLNDAVQLAETVPQFPVRSSAYNELAKRFIAHGDNEKAREISHLNLETIARIKDESVCAVALANLAELYEAADFSLTDAEKEMLQTMIRKAEW